MDELEDDWDVERAFALRLLATVCAALLVAALVLVGAGYVLGAMLG